jgi:hypothetical protein
MASLLKIKRSEVSGNPSVLGAGELAYSALPDNGSNGGDRLYIGMGTEIQGNAANHIVIGGKFFTDMLDHNKGTLTANSAIVVDANSKIDIINVDNITVDGNAISSTDTNGNISLDPNGSGYVQVIGTNGLVIPVGSTSQQGPSVAGAIRFNSETFQFEGYSGTNWSSLGGVRSADGETFISAELNPGDGDDTLRFFTNGTLKASINTDSFDISNSITTVNIDATTASTSTSTGALVVDGGVGISGALYVGSSISAQSATFDSINSTPIGNVTPSTGVFTQLNSDNIQLDGNTISSTNVDGDINITPNGAGKTVVSNLFIGADSLTEFIQDVTGGQLIAGEGIDIAYSDPSGETTISAEIASDVNRGIASFDNVDFTVTNGDVTLNVERIQDIVGAQLVGGESVTLTYDDAGNGDLTVDANIATTTSRGVASFATADFNVANGAVELKDTVIKSVTTDDGALTPSSHGLSILGGEGIDVTHSGTTITVASELATTTNAGAASFNSSDFVVTSGEVSIKSGGVTNTQLENSSVTIGSTTISLGGISTSLTGVTELTVDNLNFNGNTISTQVTNGSINLSPDGSGTVDVSGSRITSLAIPTQPTDAANKEYVDEVAQGLHAIPAAEAATNADINATFDAGTNTLTANANGALVLDGYTALVGDNILVKDQTNAWENGSYDVVQTGDGTSPFVLTREPFLNETAEMPGAFEFVTFGTLYANTGWVATVPDNFVINATDGSGDITWVQFSGAGTFLAGNGLELDGTTFNVLLSNTGGLEFNGGNEISLKSSVAGDGLVISNGVVDVVGTANRITVGADAIDIASTYVGQASIVTLGAVTTGTWQADVINPTYGGTGVNNGSSTITIGGNLEFNGAHTTIVNVSGSTNVTLPTSGTLATLAGTETLTNKTINASNIGVANPGTAAFTSLTSSGLVTFTNATEASDLSTASVVLTGGLSVNKDIQAGGDIIGTGAATSNIDGFTIDGGTY